MRKELCKSYLIVVVISMMRKMQDSMKICERGSNVMLVKGDIVKKVMFKLRSKG